MGVDMTLKEGIRGKRPEKTPRKASSPPLIFSWDGRDPKLRTDRLRNNQENKGPIELGKKARGL